MASGNAAGIICSVISVMNSTIMLLLTVFAYNHLDFRERNYVWFMLIPALFNVATAILFAVRCIVPIIPSFCVKKASNQDLENVCENPLEIAAIPGTSGYQLQVSNSSTLQNNSSPSLSFFASGSTEIQVPPQQSKPPKTYRMKPTVSSEGPGVYEIKTNPDGSSFLSAVISSKPANQKRGHMASNCGVKYARLNDDIPRASLGHAERVADSPRKSRTTHRRKDQKISERTPLLVKDSQGPISIFEDPAVYGTVDPEIQRQYPFPMYGVVPKIPGINTELGKVEEIPRTKSLNDNYFPSTPPPKELEIGKKNSWPFSDYKAPVFHFTPDKQKSKDSESTFVEIHADEEPNPRVDLELPSFHPSLRVADWIIKSPPQEKPLAKKAPLNNPQKSKTTKGKEKSKIPTKNDTKVTNKQNTNVNENQPTAKELNKFCILGRGYFYATETTDYLPVESSNRLTESTDSSVTITNSPKKVVVKEERVASLSKVQYIPRM